MKPFSDKNIVPRIAIVSFALMFAMLVILILLFWMERIVWSTDKDASITVNPDTPSVHITVEGEKIDYMCLASAEYGFPHIPKEFQCNDCKQSDSAYMHFGGGEHWDKGYDSEGVLLVYRKDNQFFAQKVDLSGVDGTDLNTSYRFQSRGGIYYQGRSQCTRSSIGDAFCAYHEKEKSCTFLF